MKDSHFVLQGIEWERFPFLLCLVEMEEIDVRIQRFLREWTGYLHDRTHVRSLEEVILEMLYKQLVDVSSEFIDLTRSSDLRGSSDLAKEIFFSSF
ncbi:hypothetical protein HNY73_008675 [Argiope bruennichi]|uniref:Uncharacterized protein n=1 Tax=Argiope bruennichi TaxID=94029 RepID=A0A8T0FC84_ARGBR|nr:hypothetical protein HNY73_008675 [Argiope bruennichi]